MNNSQSILNIQAKREWIIPKPAIEIFHYSPNFCPHLPMDDIDWIVVLNDDESYWSAELIACKLAINDSPVEFKWRGKRAWLCGH